MGGINHQVPRHGQSITDDERVGRMQQQVLNLRCGGRTQVAVDQQDAVVIGDATGSDIEPTGGECLDGAAPPRQGRTHQIGDGQKAVGHAEIEISKRHVDRCAHVPFKLIGAFQGQVVGAGNPRIVQLQRAARGDFNPLRHVRQRPAETAVGRGGGRNQPRIHIGIEVGYEPGRKEWQIGRLGSALSQLRRGALRK